MGEDRLCVARQLVIRAVARVHLDLLDGAARLPEASMAQLRGSKGAGTVHGLVAAHVASEGCLQTAPGCTRAARSERSSGGRTGPTFPVGASE
jgi:hypothetical protein